VRDYLSWHDQYDDPASPLSWRLDVVRRLIGTHLDSHPGPQQVLSLCAGDGRDVIGVLRSRADSDRVSATLVEVLPDLVSRATESAAGLTVQVVAGDAGEIATFADVLPVDLLLLVGIFGNIAPADIEHTVRSAAALCRPGSTVLWSRSRQRGDLNDAIRGWFAESGFTELGYEEYPDELRPSVGAQRYDGEAMDVPVHGHLFTFIR
jgi:hypothetical protein